MASTNRPNGRYIVRRVLQEQHMSQATRTTQLILGGALALAAAVFAPATLATPLTGTVVGVGAGGNINIQILTSTELATSTQIWGGQIKFEQVGGSYSGELLPGGNDPVIAYCLEPDEHIGYATYDWDTNPVKQGGTGIGGIGLTRTRHIQELLFHLTPAFSTGALSNTEALALQISLWEIVRETDTGYDLTSGNVLFDSVGNTTATNAMLLAQGWLDGYVNDGVTGPLDKNLLAMNAPGYQDLLVRRFSTVPAPTTLLLFVPLLSLLIRRARRAH